MTVRDSNFVTILAPMVTILKLKGNELMVFALIHGFSQDGESTFKGSLKYLNEWTGLDKTTILRILKNLCEKEYITKHEGSKNGVKVCEYSSNYWEVMGWLQNTTTPGGKMQLPRLQNTTTPLVAKCNPIYIDNNIDNNIDNPMVETSSIFSAEIVEEKKLRGTTEPRKCLFVNSRFSKLEDFLKCFDKPEYEEIDMVYYYHAVADWSASKGRMQKDWIAQTRNFVRSDRDKGKLHLKQEYQQNKQKIDVASAIEYLENEL